MLEWEGRVDRQNPDIQTKNTSFMHQSDCCGGFFCCFFFSQTNAKEKDVPKPTTDLSEDLFKVHDFDVKIDLQVPSAGDDSPGLFLVPRRGSWLCMRSTMCSTVCVLQRPSLCLSVQTHCRWRTAPPGGPSTWRTTRKEGAWSDASAPSFGIHNACVIAWECVCVCGPVSVWDEREANSQRSVFECQYNGLLIRTQRKYLLSSKSLFSQDFSQQNVVQVELFLLCIHTQTHTELCFFYAVISLPIWTLFLISERIRMDPYLQEGRSFRTRGFFNSFLL